MTPNVVNIYIYIYKQNTLYGGGGDGGDGGGAL